MRNSHAALWMIATTLLLPLGMSTAAEAALPEPCRIRGVSAEVQCGSLSVPEDPDQPQGKTVTIRYAVVPALARNKAADPVFVFAGGPGQSAQRVAPLMQPVLTALNARRDIVYVDQRGTGASNPLNCERPHGIRSLKEASDSQAALKRIADCLRRLQSDGHDLRQYATWIAVRDVDAVRAALGYPQINIVGASYGTRAALEYMRQFPQQVRSLVLDGVAPAAMALPASVALDAEQALLGLAERCEAAAGCKSDAGPLLQRIDRMLAAADQGIAAEVAHPATGERERLKIDRQQLTGLLRTPLYAPQLAAVMPHALERAADGDYAPMFALSLMLSGSATDAFAEGMHFAVICAEDMPRIDVAARATASKSRFGASFIELYERSCANVPTRPVPPAFYAPPTAQVPVLIFSGGADPATPPRHGALLAQQLPLAVHLVAPQAGHGVLQLGCASELVTRFIRQGSTDGIDGACLNKIPAPLFYRPLRIQQP